MQSRGCEDRSHVTLGQLEDAEAGHENCVYYTPSTARELFYRNEECRPVSTETGDPLRPANFQALCLVVLIEAESQKALLEEMLANGRVLTDPVRFNFSYATTTAAAPNFDVASVAVSLSVLAQDQYAADRVGQEAFDELAAAEADYELKKTQLELYTDTLNGVSVSLYGQTFGDGYSLKDMIAYRDDTLEPAFQAAEAKLESLRADYELSCTPSETVTCGRSSTAAPNPWVADDGTPCRGYSSFEVDPGSVCARWGSPVRRRPARLLSPRPPTLPSPTEQRRRRHPRRGARAAHRRTAFLHLRGGGSAQVRRAGRERHSRRLLRARRDGAPRPPLLLPEPAHQGALPGATRRARERVPRAAQPAQELLPGGGTGTFTTPHYTHVITLPQPCTAQ